MRLILFLTFVFSACTNSRSNIPPDRFKIFMNRYFKDYDYIYKDIGARGNKNYGEQYGKFEIKKNILSRSEMANVYSNLEKDGWVMVDYKSNYANFCFGEYISLNILFPLSKNETTSTGIPIVFDKMDVWNIFLYRSTSKLAKCNKNPDIIDFTKL